MAHVKVCEVSFVTFLSGYVLYRLRARLNGFRVPVGSSVRIVFTRRVPRVAEPIDEASTPLSPPNEMYSSPDNITPRASPKRTRNSSAESPRYMSPPRRESPRHASPALPPVPDMIGAEEISIAPLESASTDVSVVDPPPTLPPVNQRSTSITSAGITFNSYSYCYLPQ